MQEFQLSIIQHLFAAAMTLVAVWITVKWIGDWDEVWNAIDISDNISRTTDAIGAIENGFMSLLYAVLFAAPACVIFGLLAWRYDISSSWNYMTYVREDVSRGVGELGSYGIYLFAALTYAPTLMEVFGATFAKKKVRGFQLAVIAFTIFDLFTDLTHVQEFMHPHYDEFVNAGNSWFWNAVYEGLYYILFGLAWITCSYLFELLFILSFWCLFAFSWKGIRGLRGSSSNERRPHSGGSRPAERRSA